MSLEIKINDDIKSAMRARDEAGLRALRAIKAAILLARTSEGAAGPMSAEDELRLLQKLVKQRRDSLQIYEQQQRQDLAAKEREEIEVIERYLPDQLSPEALKDAVAAIITELGAAGPADMGRVMGVATKRLAGQADGKSVSEHVRALLSNKS